MIVELKLKDWKSFADATIYVDSLMFLIGTNASGKSNVLDALGFLRRIAEGVQLREAVSYVRGGEDWIVRYGCKSFSLSVVVRVDEYSYRYSIEVGREDGTFSILGERLERQFKKGDWKALFYTDVQQQGPTVSTRFYTAKRGNARKLELLRSVSILSQVEILQVLKEVKDSAKAVSNALKSVFILNPNPDSMRAYSPLAQNLSYDASNLAGVLAGMDDEKKESIETSLTEYVKPLPERDVDKVWAAKVGVYNRDAMLYCDERWSSNNILHLDARGMSDGTLRFIAIVMALLTVSAGSLLVIEEIDNGLHPSRSHELVKVLTEIGGERGVDVLCTTHNPVLVDALGNSMVPFISFISRDRDGNSEVRLIEDIPNLPRLMSEDTIGGLMASDRL